MRLAYIAAKAIWKTDGASPVATTVPSCRLGKLPEALRNDLDGIILFGGPTRSPVFSKWIREKFGTENVIVPEDLVRGQILDPHLTALSAGACYVSEENYNPLYTSRLPIKVTLQNTRTGDSVEYTPYEHFARDFNPVKPFVSRGLPHESGAATDYQLNVADSDGKDLIIPVEIKEDHLARCGQGSLQFVINTLGQISAKCNDRSWIVVEEPPWQTGYQKVVRQTIAENQRQYEEQERRRVNRLITANPYGWQSGHGGTNVGSTQPK